MEGEPSSMLSWARWEKHKHRGLVGLAVIASALIAAAPRNERRMFVLPELPIAFSAIPAPEPTNLRSSITGSIDDGCEPDFDQGTGSINKALEERDCGRGRKRARKKPAEPSFIPSAFYAVPDPIPLDNTPIVVSQLSPEPADLPAPGPNPYRRIPQRYTGIAPAMLLSGVAEPASWALMIGGFGIVGGMLRRRRIVATASRI